MEPMLLDRDDLQALVESARELAREVTLQQLLDTILRRAGDLTGAAAGSVILHDPRRDTLYFAAATGSAASALLERWGEHSDQQIPAASGQSTAGRVFTSQQPLVATRVTEAPAHFKGVDADIRSRTESLICVPLTFGTERFGVVQLLNKANGEFTARDRALLEHFAGHAAIAIRNARLFEQLMAHMGLLAIGDGGRRGPIELVEELNAPARYELMTVMFADMRRFTELCQVVGNPEEIRVLLNDFLEMLALGVTKEKGVVNKFLGDGLLAVFRGEQHETRAVRAALAMASDFDKLKKRWSEEGDTSFVLDFVDVGFSIVTDRVILGAIGIERGVRDYTVIGTPVVLAAFLEKQARDGRRVLCDARTFRAVRQLVEAEGPERSELRKPGQRVGHQFDCYHLRGWRDAGSLEEGRPRASLDPLKPSDLFISYSHRDREWLDHLRRHLAPYIRGSALAVWDDTMLTPGVRWREEIDRALMSARAAVLLVSPTYLASPFIAEHELKRILDRARTRRITVLWVPVSASSYDQTDIAEWQAAHDPARPLDGMSAAEQNRHFVEICKRIQAALAA